MNGKGLLTSSCLSQHMCIFDSLQHTDDIPVLPRHTAKTRRGQKRVWGFTEGEGGFNGPSEWRLDGTLILSSRQAWQAVVMWRRPLVVAEWALLLSDMMVGLEREATLE